MVNGDNISFVDAHFIMVVPFVTPMKFVALLLQRVGV